MAEEFQIQRGICGGNWWNSSRSVFAAAAATAGSPCSLGSGTFGWPNNNLDFLDIKAARSSSSSGEENDNTNCNIFQEVVVDHDHDHDQKPHHLIDSTLQIMGFGLSTSPTSDFSNQTFV